jgi:hypothetical protein
MYKIIGGDQKVYGPVDEAELRRWITEGRLNGQSQIQPEGATDWRALSSLPEFADVFAAKATPPPLASVPPPPGNAGALTTEILSRPAQLQIGRCVSQALALLTANAGLLFGGTSLVWLIGALCQFIPFIGGFVYWALGGVLYGGLYLVFLKRIRGERAEIGDVFYGFKQDFAQLMLAGFLTALLTKLGLVCCLVLPGIYLFIAWTFSVALVADKRLEFWSAMELSRKAVTRVWFEMFALVVLVFLPVILVTLFLDIKIFTAVVPIIQEAIGSGQPDFRSFMQMGMHVARMSLLLTLLLKVVLLLNLPFAVGALMYAYESLFGTRPTATA